ncbi:proton-transporting V-type ATPase complex assembly regulator TMEM9-like isoform X1 [Octopus vulgaris]|uniref:Proton-transporting V-type ATPase complex assembly regulator TMEM9-like isoform X1 n=1 Tax=Octopus vulgaris TaxID=6645 RepID=A0AA36BJU2_OCTVU|nr:proton-transporting V-type ATPase complex assembly regulator TMEM9-like isoform X1 [Octopus vulgaris]
MSSLTRLFYICLFTVVVTIVTAQYEDYRCKCVCPSQTVVNATETGRKVYIKKVNPNQCKCEDVVWPLPEKATEFCPRCECKYQSRNVTLIKIMVTIIICVVSLLFVYMVFLLCLDPLLVKKPGRYQEQTNEEVNLVTFTAGKTWTLFEDEQTLPPPPSSVTPELVAPPPPPPPPLAAQLGRQRSILNRVSDEQKKWKGTVQEQRRNIYDRHSMLN